MLGAVLLITIALGMAGMVVLAIISGLIFLALLLGQFGFLDGILSDY